MDEEPIAIANEARRRYLADHGVPVPMDQMYMTSLLEFVLGDRLDEAKAYHEARIAPILDSAVSKLAQFREQQAEAQVQAQEAQASAQARATLLGGIRPS